MTPLVSICIPCLNAERWLNGCIRSALEQTWRNVEVIVIDDGSDDGSLAVAASFGDLIRVLRAEHGGAPHARNVGLKEARGEWVQFLDADDYLSAGKLETQLAAEKMSGPAGAVYSPVVIEDIKAGTRTVATFTEGYDLYSLWISWELPQTGGALWRRNVLLDLGGWNESMPCCQEHELYLRAIKQGIRMCQANDCAQAVYRIWSEETLCRKDPRRVIEVRTRLIDDCKAWMIEKGLWTVQHQDVAGRACFEMARTLARYDMEMAAEYHEEREAAGLIALYGPAAPATYRAAYSIFGFRRAEELAMALRR